MAKTDRQAGRRGGSVRLSHVDARGRVKMVDVGAQAGRPRREAVARGSITMSREALRLDPQRRA